MRPKYLDFKMISLFAVFAIIITIIIKIDAQNTLDSRLYYSMDDVAAYFKSLSDKESYRYMITEVFDLAFIAIYTAILYLGFKRLYFKNPKIKYLALIPGAFDLFETSAVVLILTDQIDLKSYTWLGIITTIKWISAAAIVILYLFGIFGRLVVKNKT